MAWCKVLLRWLRYNVLFIVVVDFMVTYEHTKHAAGDETEQNIAQSTLYASVSSRNRRTVLRTVAAAVVETVQAPPAITFLHEEQFQIPTAVLLTESLPQKVQV